MKTESQGQNGAVGTNPFSWNRLANVIFVEQPVGVGYSYAADAGGYQTDDNQTAIENLRFLEGWMAEFPQYRNNDLWLTGESYAGVYIPTLANQILENGSRQLQNAFQAAVESMDRSWTIDYRQKGPNRSKKQHHRRISRGL